MLTAEQQEIVDAVCSKDERIVAVNAVAGSGKTSTAKAIVDSYNPSSGFYTAFNKAIVTESSTKFSNSGMECKTIHALAYKYIKPKNIEELTYNSITEDISYETKLTIISTLDKFFRSSSVDLYEFLKDNIEEEYIYDLCCKYAEAMFEGKIPPTFNFLLKKLHLYLYTGQLEISRDLLILDECQDTTAVTLEIFKLIHADKKVILGDKFQNIYSWMNTVSAFNLLDNLNVMNLTKSFRCSPNIACLVEEYGRKWLSPSFKYTGEESVEPNNPYGIAYLSRTNATLIKRMCKLLKEGKTFSLIRKADEIFDLPINLLEASIGVNVHPKYSFLKKEYNKYKKEYYLSSAYTSFFEYLKDVTKDINIISSINTIKYLSKEGMNIYKLKDTIKNMSKNNSIVLSTVHTFKGLEKDGVVLEDDLRSMLNDNILDCNNTPYEYSTEQQEKFNIYYVALTRAKTSIE